MKRQLCTLALTGFLATGIMLAQDAAPAPAQAGAGQDSMGGMGGGHRGGGMMDPDQRLARMTKRYKLTSDQQTQIKPILQDEQQQMSAMHSDTSMSRDDKRAKMQSTHQAEQQKIEAILTDDQRQKFDADQQKMQARRADRMGGGAAGAGDAGAPPAQPQ